MKYIKKFESLDEPKIGDYVACEEELGINELCDFINNTVGKIFKIENSYYNYAVKFDNIPQNLNEFFTDFGYKDCRGFNSNEILFWSENKEDVEEYLMTKKYNI